jgi:regulator of sirC expression with transglutaminase-like and TPR domain
MSLNLSPPTPLSYFASLVQSDDQFPLLEAAASLAQDEEPTLDVQQVLDDVARLVKRVKARMPEAADDLTRLANLTQVFYKDLGFGMNANDYYAPENSYIFDVLRTRRGIPISLAVIWLELAQALDLQAQGISFPGHFLVKVALEGGLVVLDPLTGESLGLDSLSERLSPYRAPEDQFAAPDLDEGETPLGLYMQACPPRDMLARMLRNLKEIFRSQEDWPRMLQVLEYAPLEQAANVALKAEGCPAIDYKAAAQMLTLKPKIVNKWPKTWQKELVTGVVTFCIGGMYGVQVCRVSYETHPKLVHR